MMGGMGGGGGQSGGGGGAGSGLGGMNWITAMAGAMTNRMSKIEENERYKKQRERSANEMRWSPWTGVAAEGIPGKPEGPVQTTAQNAAMFMGQDAAGQDRNNRQQLQQRQMGISPVGGMQQAPVSGGGSTLPQSYGSADTGAIQQSPTNNFQFQGPYSESYYNQNGGFSPWRGLR